MMPTTGMPLHFIPLFVGVVLGDDDCEVGDGYPVDVGSPQAQARLDQVGAVFAIMVQSKETDVLNMHDNATKQCHNNKKDTVRSGQEKLCLHASCI